MSEKIDILCKKIEDYQKITEKICSREDLKNTEVKVGDKNIKYQDILKKITLSLKKIEISKSTENLYIYYLLSLDFEGSIYCDTGQVISEGKFPFFKVHYYKLTHLDMNEATNKVFSHVPNENLGRIPWEKVFLENTHQKVLEDNFPYSSIQNDSGDIYKKYQSLLHILFWLEHSMTQLLSKNKDLAKNINDIFLNSEDIKNKIINMDSNNLNILDKYMLNIKEVNNSLIILTENKELIENINTQSTEVDTLRLKLEESIKIANELNESNKVVSLGLMVNEISKTFEDSANFYNKSKDFKFYSILGIGLVFLVCSVFLLWSFPLEEIIKLSDKPISLLVYLLSKFLIFIILGSLLTFLISEYKKDAKIALDFTHRKSIANVTPGFRKQVSNEENKEKFGMDAFNTLLEIPNIEKEEKSAKDNYFLAKVLKSLSDSDKKDIWSIVRKEILSKLDNKGKEK